MEERRVGRDRLQKVAARITLGNLGIAPTALCMPQTPAAGLTLGVLMKWRSHCQVCFLQSTRAMPHCASCCSR